jgi:hypothetical protein
MWNDTAVTSEKSASAVATRRVWKPAIQQESAAEFDGNRNREGKRRCRQADRGNHLGRRTVSGQLAKAAHRERKTDQQTANKGKITDGVHGVCSFASEKLCGTTALRLIAATKPNPSRGRRVEKHVERRNLGVTYDDHIQTSVVRLFAARA